MSISIEISIQELTYRKGEDHGSEFDQGLIMLCCRDVLVLIAVSFRSDNVYGCSEILR